MRATVTRWLIMARVLTLQGRLASEAEGWVWVVICGLLLGCGLVALVLLLQH